MSMDIWQALALLLAGWCMGALAFFVWAWHAMGSEK